MLSQAAGVAYMLRMSQHLVYRIYADYILVLRMYTP